MPIIDLSNYTTTLKQSSTGRTGAANGAVDGNIFFDTVNGRMELITVEEKATLDLTAIGGGAADPNPLSEADGIKIEALYAFERQERRIDEVLRQFDYFFEAKFKDAGAYELVNNRKFDDADGGNFSLTVDDRFKIRGSGWVEKDASGAIGRIYYGNASLGNIEAASQPYFQLVDEGAPVDYGKPGSIDEAVQVFGDNAVDANTTTFDTRDYESLKVRTFGFNYDEKILSDSGVTQMGGYSSGFALGETPHLTSGNYALADVYGGAQIAPWDTMSLEELDTPLTETGFTTADGSFTWVLNNPGGGTLDQVIAYLDALAQTDDDINAHATNVTNGKRVGVWYGYNAAGKILPLVGTGAVGEGLYIGGLVGADKNRVLFADDAGGTKAYPAFTSILVEVGANAVADTNSWVHGFFLDGPGAGDDFNTLGALTVQDADGSTLIKGNVATTPLRSGTKIAFEFDHALDTIGGPGGAGTDKDIVFECEGDGGVTAAKTVFTLTNAVSITASCVPLVENNL